VPKPHLPTIRTPVCLLRPLELHDLPTTLAWRNKPEVRRCFRTTDEIHLDSHKDWFSKYVDLPNDFMFIIEVDEKPVGQLGIYHISDDRHSAEFGRLLIGEPCCQGRGIARAATTEILRYAFEALQIIRVFLEVRLDNVPALGLYQSLGFMKVQEDQGFVHMEMLATQGHGKHKIAC
jgi:diamine N-acetyltransferase